MHIVSFNALIMTDRFYIFPKCLFLSAGELLSTYPEASSTKASLQIELQEKCHQWYEHEGSIPPLDCLIILAKTSRCGLRMVSYSHFRSIRSSS